MYFRQYINVINPLQLMFNWLALNLNSEKHGHSCGIKLGTMI